MEIDHTVWSALCLLLGKEVSPGKYKVKGLRNELW